MCGIAGVYIKDEGRGRIPVDDLLDMLFLGIEDRGRDATGMVALNPGGELNTFEKGALTAKDFVIARTNVGNDIRMALAHTRWATQGHQDKNENNHPVVWGSCFAVHNGHINNDDSIFRMIEETRNAEVDSLAIPAAMGYHGLKDMSDIKQGLEELEGGMAIALADPDEIPDRLILAKGTMSPLYVLNHRFCIVWASEAEAIRDAWAATVGSVPSRMANPDMGIMRGWRQFEYGEFWVIDPAEIQTGTFRPAYPTRGTTSGTGYTPAPTAIKTKMWTCTPSMEDCNWPCEKGCQGTQCQCYKGCTDHPLKDKNGAWVPYAIRVNDEYSSTATKQGGFCEAGSEDIDRRGELYVVDADGTTETLLKCYGCDDYLSEDDYAQHGAQVCDACSADSDAWWNAYRAEHDPDGDFQRKDEQEAANEASLQAIDNAVEAVVVGEAREFSPSNRWMEAAEKEDTLHAWACEDAAHELDETAEWVDWLLFKTNRDELTDRNKDLVPQVEAVYLTCIEALREKSKKEGWTSLDKMGVRGE